MISAVFIQTALIELFSQLVAIEFEFLGKFGGFGWPKHSINVMD